MTEELETENTLERIFYICTRCAEPIKRRALIEVIDAGQDWDSRNFTGRIFHPECLGIDK